MRKFSHLTMAGVALVASATVARAQTFNSGMPAGYTCAGNCGTSASNGDITAVPSGASRFGYVTTFQSGNTYSPYGLSGSTNGSQLFSSVFAGTAGQTLSFYFDYITSDGDGFPDYAYVQLINQSTSAVTTLFTARTNPSGNTVPGFGLPGIEPGVVISPSTAVVAPGETNFSGLGADSGACWLGPGNGCGSTGWMSASYDLVSTDNYELMFGVNNVHDGGYQSALLFDYDSAEGVPTITDTAAPEPSSIILLASGLIAILALSRRIAPVVAPRRK